MLGAAQVLDTQRPNHCVHLSTYFKKEVSALKNLKCRAFSHYCNWPSDTPRGRQHVGLRFIGA